MDKLAEKFAELAEKFGPHVVEAARGAARVEGFQQLVGGAFTIVICCIALYIAYLVYRKVMDPDHWFDEMALIPAGFVALFACCGIIAGLWQLADPWNWAAINNPDVFLAKKVFKL